MRNESAVSFKNILRHIFLKRITCEFSWILANELRPHNGELESTSLKTTYADEKQTTEIEENVEDPKEDGEDDNEEHLNENKDDDDDDDDDDNDDDAGDDDDDEINYDALSDDSNNQGLQVADQDNSLKGKDIGYRLKSYENYSDSKRSEKRR